MGKEVAATDPTHGYTSTGAPVHGRTSDHLPGQTRYQRINKRIAAMLTKRVGTMTTFWIFCGLSFMSLPAVLVLSHTIPAHWVPPFFRTFGFSLLVAWLCQNFIQLILLPALMVGQNLQNEASDARAAKTFEDVQALKEATERIADALSASNGDDPA